MTLQSSIRMGRGKRKAELGVSLIEMMISLGLLLIVATGVMSMAATSMSTTENNGHLTARAAEYGQDKMEQLLALQFPDQLTDTTVFPSVVGACCGLQAGGSIDPTAPVAGYLDYVDGSGNPSAAAANWQYLRLWQITNQTPTLKQITVLTQVRAGVGQTATLPQATLVTLKSSPF